MRTHLSIGALADAAGVNVETIRFYQRKGLMALPDRPPGATRRYGEGDLRRLRFIKAAQRLGFSLAEVGELLRLDDHSHCAEAQKIAVQRLADLRRRIADLRRIEARLAEFAARCSAQGNVNCPLIGSLRQG
jgi:MerR family transcriptional regulator, mercuric resistance operon regulatory protein